MKRYPDLGLLLLRITFSLLMMTHGFPKLMRFVEGDFIDFVGSKTLGKRYYFLYFCVVGWIH